MIILPKRNSIAVISKFIHSYLIKYINQNTLLYRLPNFGQMILKNSKWCDLNTFDAINQILRLDSNSLRNCFSITSDK